MLVETVITWLPGQNQTYPSGGATSHIIDWNNYKEVQPFVKTARLALERGATVTSRRVDVKRGHQNPNP